MLTGEGNETIAVKSMKAGAVTSESLERVVLNSIERFHLLRSCSLVSLLDSLPFRFNESTSLASS